MIISILASVIFVILLVFIYLAIGTFIISCVFIVFIDQIKSIGPLSRGECVSGIIFWPIVVLGFFYHMLLDIDVSKEDDKNIRIILFSEFYSVEYQDGHIHTPVYLIFPYFMEYRIKLAKKRLMKKVAKRKKYKELLKTIEEKKHASRQ